MEPFGATQGHAHRESVCTLHHKTGRCSRAVFPPCPPTTARGVGPGKDVQSANPADALDQSRQRRPIEFGAQLGHERLDRARLDVGVGRPDEFDQLRSLRSPAHGDQEILGPAMRDVARVAAHVIIWEAIRLTTDSIIVPEFGVIVRGCRGVER